MRSLCLAQRISLQYILATPHKNVEIQKLDAERFIVLIESDVKPSA